MRLRVRAGHFHRNDGPMMLAFKERIERLE
jgi:hypothetical protein